MQKSEKSIPAQIKGFLFDLDGVFYIGPDLIEGGVETINYLKKNGYPCRFITNSSTRSIATLHRKLVKLGLPIDEHEILTSAKATVLHLRQMGHPTCFLCVNDDVRQDFAEIPQTETDPEVVVLGDISDRWDYDILNRMFAMLINGAELIAMHKGRYWQEPEGLQLDIGAFVAGLEFTTDKTAVVIGKPNPAAFQIALTDLGLSKAELLMIGDDIINDVGGAQNAGIRAALVKTGKYREDLVRKASVTPDIILDSVADLIDLLKA
ncbi:MAG: TIGR01458 family HAD-type hydrolase [FCB group bacterium]|nr:TIGR01458 family HAD-type hydrolase [FCB group bacterium]